MFCHQEIPSIISSSTNKTPTYYLPLHTTNHTQVLCRNLRRISKQDTPPVSYKLTHNLFYDIVTLFC